MQLHTSSTYDGAQKSGIEAAGEVDVGIMLESPY